MSRLTLRSVAATPVPQQAGFAKDPQYFRTLMALAWPIALQSMITQGVALLDNLIVGRLGDQAISAIFLANQLTNLLIMAGIGFASAFIAIAGQYFGRRDYKAVSILHRIAFFCAATLSLSVSAFAFFRPTACLQLFSDNSQLINTAIPYFKILAFTWPLTIEAAVLNVLLRVQNRAREGFYASLTAFLINAVLNYLLIFPQGGFWTGLGLPGAAYATLVARIVEFSMMLYFSNHRRLKLRFIETLRVRIRWRLLRDYFRYGSAILAGDMFWGVNLAIQGAIVGRLGATAVTAVTVANSLGQMLSVGIYGLRDGAAVLTSQQIGSGRLDQLRPQMRSLQVFILIAGCFFAVILLICMPLVPIFFTELSPEALALTRRFLWISLPAMIACSYQLPILTGVMRAGGAVYFSMINDIAYVLVLSIPLAALAAFTWKLDVGWVYFFLRFDQLFKCIPVFIVLRRYRWVHQLTH
ncbi:MAG: MATE family efflux transporter [Eubacteriales bacterium]|nr:MATE family efflux transporter [Eubacteriales bacterium]